MLKSWAMYQHLVNRMTFESLAGIFRECSGLSHFAPTYPESRRKWQLTIDSHKGAFAKARRVASDSCDETGDATTGWERLRVGICESDRRVLFVRDSREEDFLPGMLEGFPGVLIPDFYKAYDSLPFPQQKCLRTFDQRPQQRFAGKWAQDEVRKALACQFGRLLPGIIPTINLAV